MLFPNGISDHLNSGSIEADIQRRAVSVKNIPDPMRPGGAICVSGDENARLFGVTTVMFFTQNPVIISA